MRTYKNAKAPYGLTVIIYPYFRTSIYQLPDCLFIGPHLCVGIRAF
jgi:hypothetical protein